MKTILYFATLFAAFAVVPDIADAACARQSMMEACLKQAAAPITACGTSNQCLCTQLRVAATCYDQCPGDADSAAKMAAAVANADKACKGQAAEATPIPSTTPAAPAPAPAAPTNATNSTTPDNSTTATNSTPSTGNSTPAAPKNDTKTASGGVGSPLSAATVASVMIAASVVGMIYE